MSYQPVKPSLASVITGVQDAAVQQAGGQEGFVLTGADLGADELRAGCQDASVLLVEVDACHGGHVVDVIVISAGMGENEKYYKNLPHGCDMTWQSNQ